MAKTGYEVLLSIAKKDFIPTDDELKELSSFFLCRTLSNMQYSADVANLISNNTDMPIKAQYWLCRTFVTTMKTSISRVNTKKAPVEVIDYICKYYKCNKQLAERYLKLMTEEQIKDLCNKFKQGVKK